MTLGSSRRPTARLSLLVAAVAVVLVSACMPTKKAPPQSSPRPGRFVAHYVTVEGATMTGFRSPAPHALSVGGAGTSAQSLLSDGSVSLDITGLALGDGVILSGFHTTPFRFGDLQSLRIDLAAGSDDSIVSFWFDVDGDGEFLEWAANGDFITNGADLIAQCIDAVALTAMVDESTVCELLDVNGPIGTFTVGELKAGDHAGLDGATPANIAVVAAADSDQDAEVHAVVSSLVHNGFDLLVP